MEEISEEEQEKISRFIQLSISLILRGFDEMEMQKRLELVKLLGFMLNLGFEKTYGKMIDLEKRVQALEQISKKNKPVYFIWSSTFLMLPRNFFPFSVV